MQAFQWFDYYRWWWGRLGKVYRHGQQTQKDEAIVLRDLTVSEPGVSPSKFEQEIWTNENEDFSSKLII